MSCFCSSVGDTDVTVINGVVTRVVRRSVGVSEPVRFCHWVDSSFAFVRRAIERQPERLTVMHGRALGHPREICRDTPENDGGGFIGASYVQMLR